MLISHIVMWEMAGDRSHDITILVLILLDQYSLAIFRKLLKVGVENFI